MSKCSSVSRTSPSDFELLLAKSSTLSSSMTAPRLVSSLRIIEAQETGAVRPRYGRGKPFGRRPCECHLTGSAKPGSFVAGRDKKMRQTGGEQSWPRVGSPDTHKQPASLYILCNPYAVVFTSANSTSMRGAYWLVGGGALGVVGVLPNPVPKVLF